MFGWFSKKVKKDEFYSHKQAVQTALNSAKQDVQNLNKWVGHLNNTDSGIKQDIDDIFEEISTIKSEFEDLKNVVSILGNPKLFKQRQTAGYKQTAVQAVQNGVQTAVQSSFLDRLSITERAIVMILLNTDMKLSYDDLAAMMGKDRATIRGQMNRIKQKSEGLVYEQIEKNNKKRLYIPKKLKEALLKKVKVRVKRRRID